jgi:peroxiredoxin
MKYLYLLAIATLISSCNRTKFVEFTGDLNGVDNGAFVIKDADGNILMSENVLGGKFQSKKLLPKAGYYNLFITASIEKDYKKYVYDVYLEEGNYTVKADADKLYLYPTITSTSKKQNELSEYYTPVSEKTHAADVALKNLQGLLSDKDSPAAVSGNGDAMQAQIDQAQQDFDKIQPAALNDFATKNPQNEVAAHILSQIDYKKDPASYYAAYQKFSDAQKKTTDGKSEGDDLGELVKMAPGAPAPALAGTTPDGKAFNPKSINKKIILVEFWRSDVAASRANHKQLTDGYFSPIKNKNFTVVSVSLDTKKDAWTAALKEDNMTWTQLSDLKGDASANMSNWMISAIPTYDLVDGNWHFIKRDVDFSKVATEVAKYLHTAVNATQ